MSVEIWSSENLRFLRHCYPDFVSTVLLPSMSSTSHDLNTIIAFARSWISTVAWPTSNVGRPSKDHHPQRRAALLCRTIFGCQTSRSIIQGGIVMDDPSCTFSIASRHQSTSLYFREEDSSRYQSRSAGKYHGKSHHYPPTPSPEPHSSSEVYIPSQFGVGSGTRKPSRASDQQMTNLSYICA